MKIPILLIGFLIIAISSYSQPDPPRIINTWPEFGDCTVDTTITSIRFEFDQDMLTGYSFVDCPDMVPISSPPEWKTKRILEVPVKLKPDRLYQAYLNSDFFDGFQSEAGIPMNPDYFVFGTRNYDDSVVIDTAMNRSNFEKFRNYFVKRYSYKDLKGINWENELNTIRDNIILSRSDREFGLNLLKVLRQANDIHMSMNITNRQFSCGNFKLVPVNYNYDHVLSQLEEMQISDNSIVFTGKIGNTGYILIPFFDDYWAQDLSFGIERIREMKDLPFLIIDLRYNHGGNEHLASSLVSVMLSDTITYEKVALYNESTEVFDLMGTKMVVPDNTSIRYDGKIFVLTGGNIVSSAESFVLMLKQMPNVQTIGSKTYGSSGNPQPYQVTDSITVYIPSWLAYDMNDRLIEGNGIEPDLKLEFPVEDYATNDPIFEYVLDTIIHIPFLLVSEPSIRFISSSGSATLEINSNISWTMTSDQSWLGLVSAADSGSTSITVTATENFSSLSRKATISLTGDGVSGKYVTVTQNGAAPLLDVSKNELLIAASAGSTDTFNIVSNTSWTVKSNQAWLTVNITSGSDSAMIVATATENTTGRERAASIVVSANRVEPEYIIIHQIVPVINTENEITSGKIMAFPNPVERLLYISGINPLGHCRIEISDNAGNTIRILNQEYVTTVQIDMTDIPPGIYFMRIYSGNEIRTFKVIKYGGLAP